MLIIDIAGGQAAAHRGRTTLLVRDLDFVENILLTRKSGSSGTDGFMTASDTAKKVVKLKEGVMERARAKKRAREIVSPEVGEKEVDDADDEGDGDDEIDVEG